MSKITKIPLEIRNFFSEKRRSAVMDSFTHLLENVNLDCRSLGGMKRDNCQLTNHQVFPILVLLPFFAIKGIQYSLNVERFATALDTHRSYCSRNSSFLAMSSALP